VINPLVSEVRAENLCINVVQTPFDVQKEREDFAARELVGAYRVGEGCIKRGERGEGPTLIGV